MGGFLSISRSLREEKLVTPSVCSGSLPREIEFVGKCNTSSVWGAGLEFWGNAIMESLLFASVWRVLEISAIHLTCCPAFCV